MISRETWISVIKDFVSGEEPETVKRDIKITLDIPIRRAIAIIGPRRCGKTYLMYQLIHELVVDRKVKKSRMLYVNFENDVLVGCTTEDLRDMMGIFYEIYPENTEEKTYLFLDEIQNVDDWESFARSLIDAGNVQLAIAGSSAKLLAREIATSLRGRTLSYYVYPFSFNEFLSMKKIGVERYVSSKEKAVIVHELDDYMKSGYPEGILFRNGLQEILKDILNVTIYRDIIERFGVKNQKLLRLMLRAFISSKYFSVNKFYNYAKSLGIKTSKDSIYAYLNHVTDSLSFFVLKKYSGSYKEPERTLSKTYVVDNGFFLLNNVNDMGRLLENVVFVELLRRSSPDQDLFYFEEDKKEVDFVVSNGTKVEKLIQVAYDPRAEETKNRETRALGFASDRVHCNDLLVITWDYEAEEKVKGKKIRFVPLWKWLLNL